MCDYSYLFLADEFFIKEFNVSIGKMTSSKFEDDLKHKSTDSVQFIAKIHFKKLKKNSNRMFLALIQG